MWELRWEEGERGGGGGRGNASRLPRRPHFPYAAPAAARSGPPPPCCVLVGPAAAAAAAALAGSVRLGPARGLSPIGGRRRRGGSLVIGRWRGGRGPGTLLVALASGLMKESEAAGMRASRAPAAGRVTPFGAGVGRNRGRGEPPRRLKVQERVRISQPLWEYVVSGSDSEYGTLLILPSACHPPPCPRHGNIESQVAGREGLRDTGLLDWECDPEVRGLSIWYGRRCIRAQAIESDRSTEVLVGPWESS